MTHSTRFSTLTLLLILALAFALRLILLSDANIWWDEGWAVWFARQDLFTIAEWTSMDTHPPLYFWLLHGWRLLVGDSEFALRFLSVAIGTLTVAALWDLGRLLLPQRRWVPLAGALLLATSRFALWWSQETRMYMLGGLLAILSLAFTVRLRWQPTFWAVVGYWLVTLAALWTLYLLAFLLVIEGLYWLWTMRDEVSWGKRFKGILKWSGLQLALLAAFVPWLWYALSRMNSWSAQKTFDAGLYLELYATLLTLGISTYVEQYRWIVLTIMALLGLGLLMSLRQQASKKAKRSGVALLLLMLIIPPAVVWGITVIPRSFGYLPSPAARYLLPFAPAFYLLLAWALEELTSSFKTKRAWLPTLLLIPLLLLSLWSLRDYYQQRYLPDDYKSLALTLHAHHQPHDGVVLHTDDPWPLFAYHWPDKWVGTPHLQDAEPGGADYFLAPHWEKYDALWLVVNEDATRVDPQRYFEQWLQTRARAQYEWRFGTKRLLLFAKTDARAQQLLAFAPDFTPPPAPSQLNIDSELRLVGWEQVLQRIKAGETLHTAAYVARQNRGGIFEFWLANYPESRIRAEIPMGNDLYRLPLSLNIPSHVGNESSPLIVRLAGVETTIGHLTLLRPTPHPQPLSLGERGEIMPQYSIHGTFGTPPQIELLGYDAIPIESPPESKAIELTLYWRVISPPTLSYKVFTHLIDATGQVASQDDQIPVQGTRPTTTWQPEEVIVDTYQIPLQNAPQGAYTLVIGFYDPATGNRLSPVLNAADEVKANAQMRLGEVTIK